MSGLPNYADVKEVRQALRDVAVTRDQINSLKLSIAEDQKSLERREAELRGLTDLINAKLERMDVSGPGNFGWEKRHFELLVMLSSQFD